MMLGLNAIRRLGLDGDALARVAARVGPPIGRLTADRPCLDPDLERHFDARGGFLRPPEGASRLAEVEPAVQNDLAALCDSAGMAAP